MAISDKNRKTAAIKTAKKPVQNSTKTSKVAEKPPEPPENSANLYSISALSRKFKLDRATVRERLENAEIEPVQTKAKEKLYLLDDVEIALSQSEMNEAKLRKLDLEADIKELEYKIKSGEFASVAEFTEVTQAIFSRLQKKLAVQLPGRIASKLHNANSSADVAAILKNEIAKEFDSLRENFQKYLA
jgi:hypothetical protein